jgi:hypothetical protein
MTLTININYNAKCVECGKKGATPSGLCLACATKVIFGQPMKTEQGRNMQRRFRDNMTIRKEP